MAQEEDSNSGPLGRDSFAMTFRPFASNFFQMFCFLKIFFRVFTYASIEKKKIIKEQN